MATAAAPARTRRTTTGTTRSSAAGSTRRARSTPVRRKVTVLPPARLVEDDLEVLAAEHAARDAELLELVARLVA
jgi:hypothetical protein